jgi:multidrug efflux pump subunit AcrA (membrane-fusion protein)
MNELKLREQRKREVHNLKPGFFVSWGISMIFVIIILLLVLAHIVKYPDIVRGEAIITSAISPANAVAQHSISVKSINVNDGDSVKTGDILLVFDNTGKTEDIMAVYNILNDIDINNPDIDRLFEYLWTKRYQLGDLQPAFTEFISSLGNLYLLKSSKSVPERQKFISEQLDMLNAMTETYTEITKLTEEQEQIMRVRFDRDSTIRIQKVISELEYTQSRMSYLASVENSLNNSLTLQSSKIKAKELETERELLLADYADKQIQAKLQFVNSLRTFLPAFEKWKNSYIVVSPIDGKVYFQTILRENNFVSAGEKLLTVIPLHEDYMANLKIPFEGAGKMVKGQTVKIKLNDYPYKEYGCLLGTLENISLAANTDHYFATVSIPEGLKSNFNKSLLFKENMHGIGEIITDDRSVLGRIFENVTYVFNNH